MPGFKVSREATIMFARNALALVAAIVAAAGCSSLLGDKLNAAYCKAHPEDQDCRNAFPDAGECTTSAQCSSPLAVCATDRMMCVQCTAAEHDACAGTTPVCGVDNACRKCSAHAECPSNACLPDGSCGDETRVAYVDPAGTSTTCTKASPCKKVSDALKTERPFIKFQGTTNEQVSLNNTNVTLLADPGAKLTDTMNGILLKIEGSSQVGIYDLEISGASGANTPGILVQAGGTATVTLTRVKLADNNGAGISVNSGTAMVSRSTVSGNSGPGIVADGMVMVSDSTISTNAGPGISANGMVAVAESTISGNTGPGISANGMGTISESTISGNTGPGVSMNSGTVTVTRCTLTANTGGGVSAGGGTLTLSRSVVAGNNGGGVLVNGASFTITNNFVYRNGNTTSANTGGIGVSGIVDPSKLEFNTVVDNLAGGGATSVGGVLCDRSGFAAANNLIFRNAGGIAGNVQTLGICNFGNSFIATGTSTVDNTPMFAHPNSTPFDYHLTAASPSAIMDAAGACTGSDFDGDARPAGAACDLGADERKP